MDDPPFIALFSSAVERWYARYTICNSIGKRLGTCCPNFLPDLERQATIPVINRKRKQLPPAE
jgi:hypothetical protein